MSSTESQRSSVLLALWTLVVQA